VHLHSRAVPFWIARDVDGLGTICRAVGMSGSRPRAASFRPRACSRAWTPSFRSSSRG
jgi:hypothetical protein